MTRLVQAQSKLSEKNTNKTTQEKLNKEAAFRKSRRQKMPFNTQAPTASDHHQYH